MFIHAFGAYFGLAVSMAHRNRKPEASEKVEESRYTSDIFSLVCIGIFWSTGIIIHIVQYQGRNLVPYTYV